MRFSLTTILALSSSLLSSTASAWLVRIPIHLIYPSIHLSIHPSSQVVPSTSSGSTKLAIYIYLYLYTKSTNQKGIFLLPSPSPFLELRYSLWRRRLQRQRRWEHSRLYQGMFFLSFFHFSLSFFFFFIFLHHIIPCLPFFYYTFILMGHSSLFFLLLPLGSSLQSCGKWLCDFLWSAGMAGVLSWCLCTLFVRRDDNGGGRGRRRERKRRRIDVLNSSVYISQGSGVSGE